MTQNDRMTDTFDESLDPAAPIARSDEPRGPHLPDALTRLPLGVWIFGLLAIARLIWFVRDSQLGPVLEPTVALSFISGIAPAGVAVLLPAALLLRHPDAWTEARTLVVGTIIFAGVEGMRVLGPLLQPLFEQATPGSEETPYLIPLALVYTTGQGLLAAFAVANIGLGLAQARRFLDRPGKLVIVGVAGAIIVFVAATRVISVSQLPFDQIPMSPTVAAYLASVIILGVLSIGAWSYLAATTARGARAGEDPGAGWTVGAAGAWLVVLAFVLSAAGSVVRPTEETQELFTNLGYGISIIHTLGYLALLSALLLGMPSLEPLEEDEEDDDDDWEDEEGWDDEDDEAAEGDADVEADAASDGGDDAGATDIHPAPNAGAPGSID
jgi:hypothetical protein